jgi:hypothetical protein
LWKLEKMQSNIDLKSEDQCMQVQEQVKE